MEGGIKSVAGRYMDREFEFVRVRSLVCVRVKCGVVVDWLALGDWRRFTKGFVCVSLQKKKLISLGALLKRLAY